MKNKLVISLVPVGLVGVVGTFAGLTLTGVFGSQDTPSHELQHPVATSTSTSTPAPTATPTPESIATTEPGPTTIPVTGATPTPTLGILDLLGGARFSRAVWKTDFDTHSVPYDEIYSGGVPRDGIPPIDDPKFTTLEEADSWLREQDPVVAFEINGDARAYPLRILTQHEIVNDVVGDIPVAITFCPLCNSAIVFDRRLDGVIYDFGVSGKLRNSDLLMWDRQTQSWWQQFTGEAIVGEMTGQTLTWLPASIISWSDFRASNPDGRVLSRDTGYSRNYDRPPYAGYDKIDNPPFLFAGDLDGRLLPKERVAAVTIGDADVAFPFTILETERVVSYTLNGQDLVVFFKPGTLSVFNNSFTGEPGEIGATGVFDPNLNGQKLIFRADGGGFVDNDTGSVWNILGEAIDGPLVGQTLIPIIHADHFWFAWAAFKPDTVIYQGLVIYQGAD